ncbi:hypothetical protein D3C78_1859760 [compost metagenome]
MLAAIARNLAANADVAEFVLDGAFDRLGDLANGKFGCVGQDFGHDLWCDIG